MRRCVCESVRRTGYGERRCSHSETLGSSSQTAHSICLTKTKPLPTGHVWHTLFQLDAPPFEVGRPFIAKHGTDEVLFGGGEGTHRHGEFTDESVPLVVTRPLPRHRTAGREKHTCQSGGCDVGRV